MCQPLPKPSTQDIRDEVIRLLTQRHGLDAFETREILGMLFCQAIVTDVRRGAIPQPAVYLERYIEMVESNLGG